MHYFEKRSLIFLQKERPYPMEDIPNIITTAKNATSATVVNDVWVDKKNVPKVEVEINDLGICGNNFLNKDRKTLITLQSFNIIYFIINRSVKMEDEVHDGNIDLLNYHMALALLTGDLFYCHMKKKVCAEDI